MQSVLTRYNYKMSNCLNSKFRVELPLLEVLRDKIPRSARFLIDLFLRNVRP